MKSFSFTPRLDSTVMWLVILTLLILASCMPVLAKVIDQTDTCEVIVTRVVDGDTFVCVTCAYCSDSLRIRVLELDTFEKTRIPRLYRQARLWGITPEEALIASKMATIEAKRLLEGKRVKLHRGDNRENNIDIYGRSLRYVILPDGSDFSELMRSKGYNARK